jgi:hypothetical protein
MAQCTTLVLSTLSLSIISFQLLLYCYVYSYYASGFRRTWSRACGSWTPLHWAAHHGKYDMAELLVAHAANTDALDAAGYASPLPPAGLPTGALLRLQSRRRAGTLRANGPAIRMRTTWQSRYAPARPMA